MNNGLESKLSDGVRRILSRQNAYAANALANAGDYDEQEPRWINLLEIITITQI